MKLRTLRGFSLMEMMVVLLIVSIVAAASAPMITKKLMRNAGVADSPWIYTGLSNNIAYLGGNSGQVLMGSAAAPNDARNSSLYIAGRPNWSHIAFGNDDNTSASFITCVAGADENANTRIGLTNVQQIPNNSIMLGGRQSVVDESSGVIAIGVNTINNNNSIAIGQGACALDNQSIAIGTSRENVTTAGGINSIAIGNEVDAGGDNSIAIGSHFDAPEGYIIAGEDTVATASNTIAIGQAAMARAEGAMAIGSGAYYIGAGQYHQTIANSKGSIALGKGAIAGDEKEPYYTSGAIAIGSEANANTDNGEGRPIEGIAIGNYARAKNGIAIGNSAYASMPYSIAIGTSTKANFKNSVAIGYNVTADKDNQFKLGNSTNTVYIPGNLIVDGSINGVTYGVSDKRLKNIGEEYQAGLEELKKLTFFHYTFKNDENKTPRVGVMAQDLQKVFPNAVVKGEDGYLRIRLEDMFYAVINAIKELDFRYAKLEKTIEAQQKTIDEQTKLIKELQIIVETQNKQIETRNNEIEKELKEIKAQIKS